MLEFYEKDGDGDDDGQQATKHRNGRNHFASRLDGIYIAIADGGQGDHSPPEGGEDVMKHCIRLMVDQFGKQYEGAKEKDFEEENPHQDGNLLQDGLEHVGEDSQHQRGLQQLEDLQEFDDIHHTEQVQPTRQSCRLVSMSAEKEVQANWEKRQEIDHIQGLSKEFLFVWAGNEPDDKFTHEAENEEELQMEERRYLWTQRLH